ncbi:hypothetical protein JX265_004587 [Neoarthrinium moseri]|uniref:Uncharacterized protein n=1 Tax=Neoarthrinium moseri TaxID=1658444 RepID=A0A9P9WPY6_9PEZI|nr:hypothetical protein JX265_004587 [Neoarthrinium moseri]
MPADESKSRLSESAYNSPYSRTGAPGPHPNVDPYALLRGRALSTLEAMGFDPETMVERGVLWAEDQDPFGHVTQSQYMHFIGTCFHRVMESYDEFLTEKEYDDMIKARSVIPAVRKYNLDIRRQVQYPDSLIVAYRQDLIEPTSNSGSVTYMNAATGRPLDIRTLGGGWHKLYEGFTTKSHKAATLKAKWDNEHPKTRSSAQSKI